MGEGAAEETALDSLLTRLALTEDAKLQRVLSKLLPLALSHLASPYEGPRKKVLEMLGHINKRVRDHAHIQLPLDALLDLYLPSTAPPLVSNFSVVYVEMAFERASQDARLAVLPRLLEGVAARPPAHQGILMRLVALGLEAFGGKQRLPEEEKLGERFALNARPNDRAAWLTFSMHTLLYSPPPSGSRGAATEPPQGPQPPPGLSLEQSEMVTGNAKQKERLRGGVLAVRKLGILLFNTTVNLPPVLLYPLYLVASTDSDDGVSRRGEELLKRSTPLVDMESKELIQPLFALYLGASKTNQPAGSGVRAPSAPQKLRVLNCLLHSVAAANNFPSTLQVMFDAIYGADTTTRLKQAGMEFAVWTFKHAKEQQLKPMAPIVLAALTKLVDVPAEPDVASLQLRAFAYQAIGQLSQRIPHLFRVNADMAVRIFAALESEPAASRSTLQEAAVSLSSAYKGCSTAVSDEIEALLLTYIKSKEDACRFCAVQWACNLFAPRHAAARYICMLGAGDAKLEVREVAEASLKGRRPSNGDSSRDEAGGGAAEVPSLRDMMQCIEAHCPQVAAVAPPAEQVLLFSEATYVAMLAFLHTCAHGGQAGKEGGFAATPVASHDAGTRQKYRSLLEHALARDGSWRLHSAAAQGLLELAAEHPQEVGREYASRLPWLLPHVSHADATTREAMARLLGIISAELPLQVAEKLLTDFVAVFKGASPSASTRTEAMHGAIAAAGYILAQAAAGTPPLAAPVQQAALRALCAVLRAGSDENAAAALQALGHVGLRGPLGLPSFSGPEAEGTSLPGSQQETTASMDVEEEVATRSALLASAKALLQGDKNTKLQQKTALALGHLSYGDPSLALEALPLLFPLAHSKAEEVLFAVGEALAFVWGGLQGVTPHLLLRTSFVSLTASFNFLSSSAAADSDTPMLESNGAVDRVDTEMADAAPPAPAGASPAVPGTTSDGGEGSSAAVAAAVPVADGDGDRMPARNAILHKVLEELVTSGRKEDRRAGALWLLSLVSYCGREATLQSKLLDIQEAFSHLLGETDELTQEMASKGMSVVYEIGDSTMRASLVSALVATLTGTQRKKRAVKLMEESEILPEETSTVVRGRASGTGGAAATGGNRGAEEGAGNTYRELCSLATDMGQPDLIYRFMDLANYQAGLSSKRGAAFGFAGIAKHAREALTQHLPALVPRLLRYQYDPSKAIQDAMSHIWQALVPEPTATISKYWDAIMEDLIKEAGSRLWRSREAAALALTDLLPSRRFEEVKPYLGDLWVMGLRLADDIKESVRAAGEKLCRTASSLSVRLCDASLTPAADAQEACAIVLPILLSKGMLSTLPGLRKTSLATISKLVKGAGSAVRPQIPEIVVPMLEALSSLEDQTLNYAELHAERVGISTDKLEGARLSLARESPMWETLELCLRQLDATVLADLVPKLVLLTRTGTGLNTRVGVARFIGMLPQHVGAGELRPYSTQLLKGLQVALQGERSMSARRAWAAAMAQLGNVAPPTRVQKLVKDTCRAYEDPGDKDSRLCSALILRELGRHAGEILRANNSALIPLAFFARFDEDKVVKGLFEEVWEDVSGNSTASLELYSEDITALACRGLASSSWPRKQQSAKMVADFAETLKGSMAPAIVHRLLAALLHELPGRLWEGKEDVLGAVASVAVSCAPALEASVPPGDGERAGPKEVVAALVAAAGRGKQAFREAALKSLEQVLGKLQSSDDVFPLIDPLLLAAVPAAVPASPQQDAASGSSKAEERSPAAPLLRCLGAAWSSAGATAVSSFGLPTSSFLSTALATDRSWTDQLAALQAMAEYLGALTRAHVTGHVDNSLLLDVADKLDIMLACTDDVKHSQLRLASLDCARKAVTLVGQHLVPLGNVEQRLSVLVETEKSSSLKATALDILNMVRKKSSG